VRHEGEEGGRDVGVGKESRGVYVGGWRLGSEF